MIVTIILVREVVMTPAMISDIAQTPPQFLNAKPNPSPQEWRGTGSSNADAALAKDSKPVPADTVSISLQSRQTITDVRKEDAKKEATTKVADSEPSVRAMGKVQFAYDLKGDLSVRYMDASNRLIYQVPSELMMRLKEAAAKSDSSVNTKA